MEEDAKNSNVECTTINQKQKSKLYFHWYLSLVVTKINFKFVLCNNGKVVSLAMNLGTREWPIASAYIILKLVFPRKSLQVRNEEKQPNLRNYITYEQG